MSMNDYFFDINTGKISGKVTGRDCLMQWIERTVHIERNTYPGYTSQYGVEFEHLRGKDKNFVIANLQHAILDALLVNPHIRGIRDFYVTIDSEEKDRMEVSFTVETDVGAIETGTEVTL